MEANRMLPSTTSALLSSTSTFQLITRASNAASFSYSQRRMSRSGRGTSRAALSSTSSAALSMDRPPMTLAHPRSSASEPLLLSLETATSSAPLLARPVRLSRLRQAARMGLVWTSVRMPTSHQSVCTSLLARRSLFHTNRRAEIS